jgi:RNA polymerase sigma-70 factor (ECF subfamily)
VDRVQLAAWMTAAADGDRTALDPLFAALWPIVSRYAARLVGDVTLGEDVAQDALVSLFGHLDQYDRERDALTWALAHATWAARSARRRIHRRAEADLDAAPEPVAPAPAHDRELIRAAVDTLATLPARDVEVITAALVDDDELRRALAPATFRKRLERALARLRVAWRSRHDHA